MKQLLIIAFVWPEPNSTAAGNRMLQLIHFFLENAYQITIASTAAESNLSMDLESLGIQKATIQLNHASFDEFVANLNPEIVLFDRFLTEEQFGWRVTEYAPKALRVLDTEDLHSLRRAREKCFKAGNPFSKDKWLQNDMTKREIASIYRSDFSLIISSYEMELLTDVIHMDESLLLHLPFMLNGITKEAIQAWPDFDARQDFLCIGNGKHTPNIDAIVWLKKEIWPLIRKGLPKANLNVYGAYLPEHIKQMHKPSEGFLVHGWAKNKDEVFQSARINLAPLQFGAGIKGKLIDAMQAGTPSITTKIGAEGMHDTLAWCGSIAEDAESFAQAAISFYQDKNNWTRAQRNGIAIVNQLYAKKKLNPQFLNRLQWLSTN
ncbi:MAG: glycosyltransferase, partial [Maribacter sp.]